MRTVYVRLKDIEEVKDFVDIISRTDVDYEFVQGRYIIDAKSIMGVLSLDFNDKVKLNIHTDDTKLLDKIKAFIV